MRKYFFIATGGFLGAILRYLLKEIHVYHYHENVPINTLIINIAGSFLLALVLTVSIEVCSFDTDMRTGITTGFLGAFTTFSTLCKETVGLLYEGYYFSAIAYMTVSVMLGLAAAYFGIVLAREVVSGLVKGGRSGSVRASAEDSRDGAG